MKFFDTNIGDAVASDMYAILQKQAGLTKTASKECKCEASCDCMKDGSCKCEMSCPDMCSCSKAKEAHVKNIAKDLLRFSDKLEENNLGKSAANLLTLANLLMVEATSPLEEILLDVEEEPNTLRMPEKMPDVLVSNDMLDEKALELDSLEKKLESLDEMEAEPMSSKKTEEEKFEEIMRDWAKINKDEK